MVIKLVFTARTFREITSLMVSVGNYEKLV